MPSLTTTTTTTILLAALTGASTASPLLARQAPSITTPPNQPAPTPTPWDHGATPDFPIHSSCNATERAQLQDALHEMLLLAQHAKQHILRFGNSSAQYSQWFGQAPTAGPIGWYERILSADRADTLFRCDDPDGNCALHPDTYAGHWRGSNATQETVICPRSFSGIRWSLNALCSRGYTVANSPANAFFATDLLHRVLHVPRISEGLVGHFAEDYPEMLALARERPEEAVLNSDSLQLFAVDVYGFDISVPGVGCHGVYSAVEEEGAPAATPSPSGVVSSVAVETPSVTQSADASCHTHSDGFVHCD
ncbi:zincin [Pseudovirgaria hyperparasitica]|uniref:Zincin n=1 Tax=Pseudovirgaria hyperparasitica TaxID=470096 RepID=A0A6A6VUL8_9PEZI|nr:zincin [Pseudovirgaria hyperparasitica]KAF2753424.1 zincin [Pseudovirgaria hyperparasitica]